ncbi:MAG: leucine-rich repeat domain-containing protein, partial [Clostridia bacterium]|nr:leucine-rich repeat domain-containing protein [Clostridia bacterium]
MKKRVEKIIALIMCAVMIFGIAPLSGFVGFGLPGLSSLISVRAKAYGGTYGDLSYEINNGTVVITDCDENANGELAIPDTIENCPVTNVDDYAFEGCAGLTGITIPDSVTGIGDGAFSYCIGLTSVTIGNSVTSIGDHAFEHCGLTGITIPDSVTSIDDSAFSGCAGLTGITVASGNTVYHSEGDCLIETASKTLIAGCKYSIIPDDGSVTSIGDGAFTGRTGLESFTIPFSVTSIGDSAFAGCTDLTNVTIPYSVTRIGDSAFYLCAGLEDVYFTGTEEEWNAIEIGEDNTTLLSANINFNNPDSIDPFSVLTYEIIDGEVTITGCDKNAGGDLEIPGTIEGYPVTSIGNYAFNRCTELTSITIPDSVISIGDVTFYGC